MVHVSAPAKLFLLGEHAVVYNGPAILTAVDTRLHLKLSRLSEPVLVIDAPDVGLSDWRCDISAVGQNLSKDDSSSFIRSCITQFKEQYPFKGGLHITTHNTFKREYGIGSSSAVVAATLYALAQQFEIAIDRASLLEMGLNAIQTVQNLGSGADLAAAIYGGTIYYTNSTPRTAEPLPIDDLPLLIVYSGTKASTVNYVQAVEALKHRHPTIIEPIIDTMHTITESGRAAMIEQNWSALGELMDIQHGLLHALGVDTPNLARIALIAREAGAYGAKLSGAGGGDCAIVLGDTPQLRTRLAELGESIEILDLKPHAEGVRVEAS